MKLTKLKASEWNGNGFGSNCAEWIVAGTDIRITNLASSWYAIQGDKKIARGFSKKDLLENLELKLAA